MYFDAGKIIARLRKQRGISQEKLAGLSDRSNLSRIERGQQGISRVLLEFYLDRLGYSLERFTPFLLSDDEASIYALRDEIEDYIANDNVYKAKKTLAEMEALDAFKQGLHKQFLLTCKAGILIKTDIQQTSELLHEAIVITIEDFDEDKIQSYLLARNDIKIINMMATIHSKSDELDRAISLLEGVATVIRQKYMDAYEKARSLTLTLYNLSCHLGAQKRYMEEIDILDEAIAEGQANRCYGLLPKLFYNKAYCLFMLDKPEEAKPLMLNAYYTCITFGLHGLAKTMKTNVYNNFKYAIPD